MNIDRVSIRERVEKAKKAVHERLRSIQHTLLDITKGCRDDMHEPDEQGVTAEVIGTKFDNAFGSDLSIEAVQDGYQEIVVILRKHSLDGSCRSVMLNLADLVALAREANLEN